jgi:streptogramin lyase
MDPKTGKFTEWPVPPVPAGDIPGTRDIQVDKDDNIWFPRRIPGPGIAMTRFNPKTEEVSTIEGVGGQFLAIGPDGKIWAGFARIDPKTMKVEDRYTRGRTRRTCRLDLTVLCRPDRCRFQGQPWAPDFEARASSASMP